MTCKRTLHSRFASGRFTPVLLFTFSLLLMLSAFWYPASAVPVTLPAEPSFMGGLASRLLSTLFYAVSAILISGQTFFDRRVRWVGAFYMWMVAVLPFVNGNSTLALSSLLSVLAFVILFACQYKVNSMGLIYASFLVLGFQLFVTPFAIFLIPLYWAFCLYANISSPRGFVASLLGLATPFWLLLGTEYVLSDCNVLSNYISDGLSGTFRVSGNGSPTLFLILLGFALLLLLPSIVTFMGSVSPAKPLLRRRLSFIMMADAYLLLLCCLWGDGVFVFYSCSLFCQSVIASYIFSVKETKLIGVYFLFVNLIMVAIATQALWLKH